jgi:hypothetical protein
MTTNTKESREAVREARLRGLERGERPELGAVWGTGERLVSRKGQMVTAFDLVAYSGTKGKPDLLYYYGSSEMRAFALGKWLDGLQKKAEYFAREKAKKKARDAEPNPAKVGDVLCCSWGYEQTNVDWFEVVETNGRTNVTIRKIAADRITTGWEQGTCLPLKGEFIGEPKRVRVNRNSSEYSVRIYDFASAYHKPQGANATEYWSAYA